MTDQTGHRPTRRALLVALSAGSVGALAGCLGDEESPDPIALDGSDQLCDNCNMVVGNHRGPKGQAFYLDDAPTDAIADREDGVAWFCSTWCTYSFVFEYENRGHDPVGLYGTDYSTVEYQFVDSSGVTFITEHVEAEAFADLTDLTLVVDSDVQGAMGSSLVGFSDADDADAFADEHGGDIFDHDDVSADLIAALGM